MADWPLVGGGSVRLEVQPVYCANCGKPYGIIPKENTTFSFWVCPKCFEKYGEVAGTLAIPDDVWAEAVAEEMQEKHGRHLSEIEIIILKNRGELSKELLLLEKESPYPVARSIT
jgi:hypothetical protein